jgi:ABC-type molybdate transport system substrate-binding protein
MRHVSGSGCLGLACCLVALSLLAPPAWADTLKVAGAGSLKAAFSDLLRHFPAGPDSVADPEFGASGLMREKIEAGLEADLFASADMEQARRLAVGHPDRPVILFTRNRLCALAAKAIGLTPTNMLDRLLDPAVRIATSTPGADPGGDYAWAVFARAEAIHAGARAALEGKAQTLLRTPSPVPGKGRLEGLFISDRADVALVYCSGAPAVAQAVQGLSIVPLPPDLTVVPAYGMVPLNTKPVTLRFAAFVMSEDGQAILRAHGFDPVGVTETALPPAPELLVQRAGQASRVIAADRIGTLKPLTETVSFMTEHGDLQVEWTGPSLWDVLTASGVLDGVKPSDQVRLAARITGADGYTAIVALGEIAPQFAGRPVQIADHMNGQPIPDHRLRLVVPGDKRGDRSVRDVVRIDVE